MIYRLELENFYSFRDRQVLDLTVPLNVPPDEERFKPVFDGSKQRAPKVVALFGANASGKSTVLRAISFLAWFIRYSHDHSGTALPIERFNDKESSNQPVRLAVEFGSESSVYRYELHLAAVNGSVGSVIKEVLLQKPQSQSRWSRVFERKLGSKLKGSKQFPLTGFAQVIDKVRDNASVTSTLAKFNHEPSERMIESVNTVFTNILITKFEPFDSDVFLQLANSTDLLKRLNADLQRIDVGIEKAFVEATANGPTLFFHHAGHEGVMPWNLESHGTQSFVRIFPWLISALASGGIAVLDELDVSIHPLVLPEIVRWFYSTERNPNGAQLWMSCHAVSLLEDMEKEEVVLCEKDRNGRSRMYSLSDVRPVLRKDNYYKKYLGGEYGAVPRIG